MNVKCKIRAERNNSLLTKPNKVIRNFNKPQRSVGSNISDTDTTVPNFFSKSTVKLNIDPRFESKS